ncbi:MAG: nicotinamide-nucleotide amidohydrolase family protein, partial [Sphingobacteriales bacterium]
GIILITGGLGPTKDDITKVTLAKYFNMGFRRDEETLEHVTEIFARLNRPMIESNRRQADVPEGCTVIKNKNGTAPCMWFESNGKIIVSLPGVPYEMMYLMEEEILPRITKQFDLPFIFHKTILTAGIGESFLAAELASIEDNLPDHIKLAYLPRLGQVRLRLSGTGSDEQALTSEIQNWAAKLVSRIKKYVVIEDDIALEKAVLDIMKARNLTLSTAESCTGGYISHLITQHSGSSSVFIGGAVVYSNQLKESVLGVNSATLERFGAVSEETIRLVTTGACVAITGTLVESMGSGQKVEVKATDIHIYGPADPDKFPLQPKKHSMEFLREIAHLRPRTNTFAAVLRIRHALAFAVHQYFNDNGFFYLHTPI